MKKWISAICLVLTAITLVFGAGCNKQNCNLVFRTKTSEQIVFEYHKNYTIVYFKTPETLVLTDEDDFLFYFKINGAFKTETENTLVYNVKRDLKLEIVFGNNAYGQTAKTENYSLYINGKKILKQNEENKYSNINLQKKETFIIEFLKET